jgi:hypothetical protein
MPSTASRIRNSAIGTSAGRRSVALVKGKGDRLRYAYDFGDCWEHDILVEEVSAAEPDALYPICLTGKGACPPEDCGGVWGYGHLREVLADPTHEEHQDMLEHTAGPGTRSPYPWAYLGKRLGSGSSIRRTPDPCAVGTEARAADSGHVP